MPSALGTLEAAILAVFAGAIAGLTTRQGPVSAPEISAHPFAYTLNPATASEPLAWAQAAQTATVTVVLCWRKQDRTRDQRFTDAEQALAAIEAEPTLGGLCRRATVNELIFDEIADEERAWAVAQVFCEGYR